jgi:hypothetical protein
MLDSQKHISDEQYHCERNPEYETDQNDHPAAFDGWVIDEIDLIVLVCHHIACE